jgi:hypothetical protein
LKYTEYISEQIKIGRYQPQDILSMDESNFDVDQQAGETLTNRGDRTIDQSVTGSTNRCTVLLAVTMSGEKLTPYIILKVRDTRGSQVWNEFSAPDLQSNNGYPKYAFYAVQQNAWMDKNRFLDWTNKLWKPLMEWLAVSKHGSSMIMDAFKVHLVSSCLPSVQDTGTEDDFVVKGYTGCVQITDKGINRPFKGYSDDNFERWMMP